jgi:hypothetical protein
VIEDAPGDSKHDPTPVRDERDERLSEEEEEARLDQRQADDQSKESFPASDPPSW